MPVNVMSISLESHVFLQTMRGGNHLSKAAMTNFMYAMLGAIEADHGFAMARQWLTERLLSVVDVEDSFLAMHWRRSVSSMCRSLDHKQPSFYSAGITVRYNVSNSPFKIATEIVYIKDDHKVREQHHLFMHRLLPTVWSCEYSSRSLVRRDRL
jgi:hypothetical protein